MQIVSQPTPRINAQPPSVPLKGSVRPSESPVDYLVSTLASSLCNVLQRSGLADATPERLASTLSRLRKSTDLERVAALKEVFGASRWTTGTYIQVAGALTQALEWRPSLPGSGKEDTPKTALRLIAGLTSPPRTRFTTSGQLEALGYSKRVAEQLLRDQPAVVSDLGHWMEVEPSKAGPRDLYRAMALPGGMQGYDPHRTGSRNEEMYFSPREEDARAFGMDRLRGAPGLEGVLLHCQLPGFMVAASPPQGGDASWPIVRARDLPDPHRPDIRPYIAEVENFQLDPHSRRFI